MPQAKKKTILLLGKLPPPYIGPAMATKIILNSRLNEVFELRHLDTSDHRDINTLGKIDLENIYIALKQYLKLIWLLAAKKPDLVYLPNKQTTIGFFQDLPVMVIAWFFRKKLVCHLRGGNFKNWYSGLTPLMKWVVRKAYAVVDGQIVLGRNLKHLFDGIVANGKIYVVPNGGDFEFSNKSKNGHAKKIRVLYLANFHRSKGVLDLLYAIPKIYKKNPYVEFTFAGNWRDKRTEAEFKQFILENKHLPINVQGPVSGDTKLRLYSQSDLFVFPTHYPAEGHPWVIVEAMAAGLPVIATDHGAIAESVIDGKNGIIVERKNPKQIADKILFMSKNQDVLKGMAQESRRLYLENFTEDIMVRKLNKCFNSLLQT